MSDASTPIGVGDKFSAVGSDEARRSDYGPRNVWKAIKGRHDDLTRVRASPDITHLHINGAQLGSLSGISRFSGLRWLRLTNTAVDELGPLVAMDQLRGLRIEAPRDRVDLDSIFQLRLLEELGLKWISREDLVDIAGRDLAVFTHLVELHLYAAEDFGLDPSLAWLERTPQLRRLCLENISVPLEETELLIRAGKNLGSLVYLVRSDAQYTAIATALNRPATADDRGMGVTPRWIFPEPPPAGTITETDGQYSVVIRFRRVESGSEKDELVDALLDGEWADLAPELELDRGTDEMYFYSKRREVLEDLVKRARRKRVL